MPRCQSQNEATDPAAVLQILSKPEHLKYLAGKVLSRTQGWVVKGVTPFSPAAQQSVTQVDRCAVAAENKQSFHYFTVSHQILTGCRLNKV